MVGRGGRVSARGARRVVEVAAAQPVSRHPIADVAVKSIASAGERFAVFNASSHPRGGAPSCGWAVVDRQPSISSQSLENEFLRVEWNDGGALTSIWDKEVEREVLGGPGNVLELHDDNPRRWDAWDLDIEHRNSFVSVTF
ncbi:MAG: hypothetical protein E6I82_06720, partial [Chloroflexi bacterium]